MELTVKERVQNGADWLDENFPGWEDRIDLGTLKLEEGEHCICGQVFKEERQNIYFSGYNYAQDHLFDQANAWLNSKSIERACGRDALNASILLGFNVISNEYRHHINNKDTVPNPFDALQEAWVELLKDRAVNRIMAEYTIK